MVKKYITSVLIGLLLNLAFLSTAMANTERDAKFAARTKANIAKLGIGEDAKVEIKLKDGAKLKGHVSDIKESSFVVVNDATGVSIEIPYVEVQKAKGKNSKTGQRIFAIVLIVAVFGLLAWGLGDN